MSTITHVGTVLIGVADQDAALAFWHRLGFATRIDGPFGDGGRWVEVAPPGGQTSLALVPRAADAGAARAGTEVSLAAGDAEAAHAALRQSGADVDAELIRLGGGVPPMFTFRDPDGNPFRVVERA